MSSMAVADRLSPAQSNLAGLAAEHNRRPMELGIGVASPVYCRAQSGRRWNRRHLCGWLVGLVTADRTNIRRRSIAILRSRLPQNGDYLRVSFGRPRGTDQTPPAQPRQQAAAGNVVAETDNLDHGEVTATVRMRQPGVVVLSASLTPAGRRPSTDGPSPPRWSPPRSSRPPSPSAPTASCSATTASTATHSCSRAPYSHSRRPCGCDEAAPDARAEPAKDLSTCISTKWPPAHGPSSPDDPRHLRAGAEASQPRITRAFLNGHGWA